ncbi:MAG: DNA polymerase [Acidimicrobiia bacterium]
MPRIFLHADWSQLESWLTAYFSGDATLTAELQAQLEGGHKVHALNAALLYGCEPEEAMSFPIILGGRPDVAYNGGKRVSHAWNYGMEASYMASTFWIAKRKAEEMFERLNAKYKDVVAWRERMADEVFGVQKFVCNGCQEVRFNEGGKCNRCSTAGYVVSYVWSGYETFPSREMRTPFGRRRLYMGLRNKGKKALAAQLPQSCGASMWYRTLQRLNGFEVVKGEVRNWTTPNADYAVRTGTYDSFLIECDEEEMISQWIAHWLAWTMEQSWPQLAGWRFPCEMEVGHNWGKYDEAVNPQGLKEIEHVPFQGSEWSEGRRASQGVVLSSVSAADAGGELQRGGETER